MRNALSSILLFLCVAVSGQQVVMGYPFQTVYNPASGLGIDTTDLDHWWSYDEASGTLADSHKGDDGTFTDGGGSGYGGTGKINDGLDFERSSEVDYVTTTGFNYVAGDFTVTAWINQESQTVDQSICGGGGAGAFHFGVDVNGGLECGRYTGGNSSATSITVTTGVLTFVAVIYDQGADEATFYINANSEVETFSLEMSNVTNQWGARNGTEFSFDGVIDEPNVWDVALTAGDIAYLYNSGNGKGYGL